MMCKAECIAGALCMVFIALGLQRFLDRRTGREPYDRSATSKVGSGIEPYGASARRLALPLADCRACDEVRGGRGHGQSLACEPVLIPARDEVSQHMYGQNAGHFHLEWRWLRISAEPKVWWLGQRQIWRHLASLKVTECSDEASWPSVPLVVTKAAHPSQHLPHQRRLDELVVKPRNDVAGDDLPADASQQAVNHLFGIQDGSPVDIALDSSPIRIGVGWTKAGQLSSYRRSPLLIFPPMPSLDPAIAAHLEWLGFVRPTGLVVSAPALARHGATLNRRDVEGQRRLQACVEERAVNGDAAAQPVLPDFRAFAANVLDWRFSPKGYAGTPDVPIPSELEVRLPDSGEVLRPTFAVRQEAAGRSQANAAPKPTNGNGAEASPWQLLVDVRPPHEPLDRVTRSKAGTDASPHGRLERLLRGTGAPAGLLCNGTTLRLVSAPRGESSGWLDFRVADMVQTAGRPIAAAMRLLLNERRLLAVPKEQRLAGLLAESRKFQNEVSERLASQVLHALYEMLRGFQAAHDTSKGELLATPLQDNPDDIYRALLTLVLRLVFLLYAEERDMLPQDETYLSAYSLAGLHQRLREDAALHPDTMDQRYGAYAQLLALFRMIHDGARSGAMKLPPRHGALFDPERYRFLEGRGHQTDGARRVSERIEAPWVSDGTIYRVLEKLIVLDGERILDVKQRLLKTRHEAGGRRSCRPAFKGI